MKIIQGLKGVKSELKHVSWPTRRQTVQFTVIVIVLSLATALILGVLDTLFVDLLMRLKP